jgi:hypothetical protein
VTRYPVEIWIGYISNGKGNSLSHIGNYMKQVL